MYVKAALKKPLRVINGLLRAVYVLLRAVYNTKRIVTSYLRVNYGNINSWTLVIFNGSLRVSTSCDDVMNVARVAPHQAALLDFQPPRDLMCNWNHTRDLRFIVLLR